MTVGKAFLLVLEFDLSGVASVTVVIVVFSSIALSVFICPF